MRLSQDLLNRVGQHAASMYGATMEVVLWAHYAPGQPLLEVPVVPVRLKHYTQQELTADQLEPGDLQLRVQVSAIAFRPGLYDTITRPDGTAWRLVYGGSGAGHVWHVWAIRQLDGAM
jgi:hypothetical protein